MNGMIDLLLIPLGLALGAWCNWAIYAFAYWHPRRWSPWSRLGRERWDPLACLPVLGWWHQRQRSAEFGRLFWVRPLLIEIAWGAVVPVVYAYVRHGGLTASSLALIPADNASQIWLWTAAFTGLFALLTVATFIDFDEKTIPDEITLPGTLLALALAWWFPQVRLPEIHLLQPGVAVEPLQFASPAPLPAWPQTGVGLSCAVAIIWIWMVAIVPKRCTLRRGWRSGWRTMWLSIFPPRRRTVGKLNLPARRVHPLTKLALGLGVLLTLVTLAAWWYGRENWNSYFSQLAGLALGGGLVWAVRIIASQALDQEALGFGDVTLMAMIGAFLGWQPALLVFCFAPFAAIAIALIQLLLTRRPEIAFGPYLSVAAVFLVFDWGHLWNDWAATQVFLLGPFLLVILGVCLLLMAVMLAVWQRVKQRW